MSIATNAKEWDAAHRIGKIRKDAEPNGGCMPTTDSDSTAGKATRDASTVFVSYARADQPSALPIIELIEAAGFTTWWDGLLEGGERFSRTTEEALDRAKAVVVLWSKTSVSSHWVHDEATRGRDRRVLVPLSLDGTEPPLGFRQFQVIDLSRSKPDADDPGIQRVLRAVAALHDKMIDLPAATQVRVPRFNRRVAIGSGMILAAAGGVAVWKGGLQGGNAAANSVAVLPFDNLSGDPQQRYFSDGLSSEIRSYLSRNALLEVVGQTSSNQFGVSDEDAHDCRQIARLLPAGRQRPEIWRSGENRDRPDRRPHRHQQMGANF